MLCLYGNMGTSASIVAEHGHAEKLGFASMPTFSDTMVRECR